MVSARTLAIGIAVWALGATPALAAQPRSASLTGPSSRLGFPALSPGGHAQKSSPETEATGQSAPAKSTASAKSSTTTTSAEPEAPVPVVDSDTPPPGRYSSPDRILQIADRLPKMRAVRAEHPGSFGDVYLKGPSRWQVSYFSKQGKEIGLVILADYSGHVLEQWTGFQIAWTMARGYPGAFGRHVNALYIWIPMCFLFFVPFFDWRKPLRLLHLDLLVLLSFSVSLAFFNHAHIYASTPLVYPPLVYLLVRMLLLARVGRRTQSGREAPKAATPAVPPALARDRRGVPAGLSHRAERDRLQRDRRRLCGRDRRRAHRPRRAAVRRLSLRQRTRRHLRPGQLRGLRALPADLRLERHAGTTCPPRTPPRSCSTCWRSACCSCSAAACAARASGSCSPTRGSPTPSRCMRWRATQTTRSWRC